MRRRPRMLPFRRRLTLRISPASINSYAVERGIANNVRRPQKSTNSGSAATHAGASCAVERLDELVVLMGATVHCRTATNNPPSATKVRALLSHRFAAAKPPLMRARGATKVIRAETKCRWFRDPPQGMPSDTLRGFVSFAPSCKPEPKTSRRENG